MCAVCVRFSNKIVNTVIAVFCYRKLKTYIKAVTLFIPPPPKLCGGGGYIGVSLSVGPSVRRSVAFCPLYFS